MLPPEIQCVVGIDVAKQAHVVCALTVPGGAVRHKPSRIEATAEGYALLRSWLETWGTSETLVLGLEATSPLGEPLYDALTQAGYTVLVLNPRQTASWASSRGLRAKTDGSEAQTLAAGPWPVGGVGACQYVAVRDGAGAAYADPRPPRPHSESHRHTPTAA
jgi:transposase